MTTDSLYVVAIELQAVMEQSKDDLGVEDVWYGDQNTMPRYPAVCVEPSDMIREIAGTGLGGATENTFQVIIYVYHGPLQDLSKNRKEADELCARIEFLLHNNLQLNGKVIHGFIVRNESGAADKAGSLLAAHRLTWEGKSKTILGVAS